jgi:hypothetical protein
MLNFNEMEIKFGAVAYHYLAEIEKAAGIRGTQVNDVDPETRLANALRIQDSLFGETGALLVA